jgi:hypothetical protein
MNTRRLRRITLSEASSDPAWSLLEKTDSLILPDPRKHNFFLSFVENLDLLQDSFDILSAAAHLACFCALGAPSNGLIGLKSQIWL